MMGIRQQKAWWWEGPVKVGKKRWIQAKLRGKPGKTDSLGRWEVA